MLALQKFILRRVKKMTKFEIDEKKLKEGANEIAKNEINELEEYLESFGKYLKENIESIVKGGVRSLEDESRRAASILYDTSKTYTNIIYECARLLDGNIAKEYREMAINMVNEATRELRNYKLREGK